MATTESATRTGTVASADPGSLSGSVWKRPIDSLLTPTMLRIVLWGSVAMVVLAIVMPLPGIERAILGVGWLAPIIWIPRQMERVARAAEEDRWARSRRYHRLRGAVSVFIDEVKRLNWLAVDASRGLREETKVQGEMDAIEDRLHGLVGEIRAAAGIVDRPE